MEKEKHAQMEDEETADDIRQPCDVFCQMDILRNYNDDLVWKEIRRWVKFEEVLEEKGKRWSKPHVSSLFMQSLTKLQMTLASQPIYLDLEVETMFDVVDSVLEGWKKEGTLDPLLSNHIRSVLLKPHKHHHIRRKQVKRHESKRNTGNTMAIISDDDSAPSTPEMAERNNNAIPAPVNLPDITTNAQSFVSLSSVATSKCSSEHLSFDAEPNRKFLRKIPEGAEVFNVLVGEVEDLKSTLSAFIRLKTAKNLGNITEVKLATRFMFMLLVPKGQLDQSVEIGRCMGTLMTDELFRDVAYQCRDKVEIMSAVQEFASQVTVLPPGSWDPRIRIEPPDSLPTKESRKGKSDISIHMDDDDSSEGHGDANLERTGRLFGGLINDVKRKLPWYRSDFTDALHVQCFASFLYLFLATLTPNVAFGGLLGEATHQYMGTMECILAAAVSGIIYALFSGQPLNILGSTGPMLVLEMILYNLCHDHHWDFMPARLWVGLWTALFLLLIVAFDLSSLVRYITRFTEESFACLIALIFIYQAIGKCLQINSTSPMELNPSQEAKWCVCIWNDSAPFEETPLSEDDPALVMSRKLLSVDMMTSLDTTIRPSVNFTTTSSIIVANATTMLQNCTAHGGVLYGKGCDVSGFVPDVFLFSIFLFIGTSCLAFCFVGFRSSLFCPSIVRQTVSDFSVLLAILIMVGVDAAVGLPTPKLSVPTEFKPTRPDRGWFINPISSHNPWWLIIAAALPAGLATILVFMDQQITSVIVNRAENKLKKGSGYHLDLLVLAILVIILSFLGLPWYVAATVTAIAHVMSLKKESECTAPGEKPTFLGVREQRVTALLVGVFSGLAVLITSVLKFVPMPVLYGVFFYMGISALNGMQLVQRVLIVFMPQKYQPDYKYLRHVRLRKVHLFTGIQVLCLASLWVVKSVKAIAIAFPIMVVAIAFIRKGMDYLFNHYELKWLDDLLPSSKQKEELQKSEEQPEADDIGEIKRKAFQRSLSVPASVNASREDMSGLVAYIDLPFLHRTTSGQSVETKKTSNEFLRKPVSKRKLSLLSLPVNPTFILDEEDKNDKLAVNFTCGPRDSSIA